MKRILLTLIIAFVALGTNLSAQPGRIVNEKDVIDSLTTIDPAIVKYFPRWKVCEPDLQVQIYQHFLYLGYDPSEISQQDIEVLAGPKEFQEQPFEILMISSKNASMNAVQIESNLSDKLMRFLSGEFLFRGINRATVNEKGNRDYCFTEIPPETPLAPSQAKAIIDFFNRTDVSHSFSLSMFEQSVKIGGTGFWLRSVLGTDQIGMPFWYAGESKIMLQRPLYQNEDSRTRTAIPYLINAYLGGGYRITSGSGDNSLFEWLPKRQVNAGPGGKFIAGFDFHMPFHPEAGIAFNIEMPFKKLEAEGIEESKYTYYTQFNDRIEFADQDDPRAAGFKGIIPLNRASGQITAFYHWWINPNAPENYFRFDLGVSYSEIREAAMYRIGAADTAKTYFATEGILGLKTYKPSEFGDWVYAKAEYRNQGAFPFGLSIQYSNQILLNKVWIPLFGDWFYIEGKYAKPVRNLRPFEDDGYFMISPVLRLTI